MTPYHLIAGLIDEGMSEEDASAIAARIKDLGPQLRVPYGDVYLTYEELVNRYITQLGDASCKLENVCMRFGESA